MLADVILHRAALVVRVAFDHRPDPLAGLKVDDEDLSRLLTELPGLAAGDTTVVDAINQQASAGVAAARQALRSYISADNVFGRIVRFVALSDLEAEVLALACAVELDPRRQRVVGYLNDDVSQRRLNLFTVQLLFSDYPDAGLVAGPGSGLRRAGLIVPAEPGPLASVALVPSPSVVWWLSGDRTPDPELPAGSEVHVRPAWAASPGGGYGQGCPRLVLVPGGDRARRRQAASAALGDLLVAPLPGSASEWDALVRQATLEQLSVMIELAGPLPPEARERVQQAKHLRWALASPEELPLDCLPTLPWRELAVAPAAATGTEWAAAVTEASGLGYIAEDEAAQLLAGDQALNAEQLELVQQAAPGVGGISAAVRRLAAGHISALAPRIRPSRTWADLVLDDDRTERLKEVVARCRHKRMVFSDWGFSPFPSAGVVALFSGPSGTGKTLAAEIIAGELGLDLYKVDLAALVSKWVGETEKNLAAVFAAAEASNVALFFDEADAVFGKRSEVSDAHDRYANIEVAYLLQRLERYEGLVVLATNLATNIDPAFLRRVHVSVDFPMPEEPERRRIWDRSLPPTAPSKELDLDLLAKLFKLSGGAIRNSAVTSAFIAAEAGGPITMHCVMEAVQREMRKMGRLLTPADFGPYSALVKGAPPR